MGILADILKKMTGSSIQNKTPAIFSNAWLKAVSDDVLKDEREKKRIEFTRGNINAEKIMLIIDKEMIRRANAKYEKEHPNAKPRPPREHGWNLLKDD